MHVGMGCMCSMKFVRGLGPALVFISILLSQLRITLWSLVTGTATHIQYPVHSDSGNAEAFHSLPFDHSTNEAHPAYAFRADGRYFALAERHRSKDTLGVYDALHGYSMVRVRASSVLPNVALFHPIA